MNSDYNLGEIAYIFKPKGMLRLIEFSIANVGSQMGEV